MSKEKRLEAIQREGSALSLTRQCELLSVTRSSIYTEKKKQVESELNLKLLSLIDLQYSKHSDFGAERMHTWLVMDMGYKVNKKRIERLYYKVLGLKSLLPGPSTSTSRKENKKYPYLLRNMAITKENQVWATDITYIRMPHGFMYLMAVIDIYSRKILHWSLSNTMDSSWCCEVIKDCIDKYGVPEILNTDQGSQFTSDDFVYNVINQRIKLSMDGKGRALDNIYIERFCRTIKYEYVYLHPCNTATELYKGISQYMDYYNKERRHTSLANECPDDIYHATLNKLMAA